MAEWFKAHAWKVCILSRYQGFESLSLRQLKQYSLYVMEKLNSFSYFVIESIIIYLLKILIKLLILNLKKIFLDGICSKQLLKKKIIKII